MVTVRPYLMFRFVLERIFMLLAVKKTWTNSNHLQTKGLNLPLWSQPSNSEKISELSTSTNQETPDLTNFYNHIRMSRL